MKDRFEEGKLDKEISGIHLNNQLSLFPGISRDKLMFYNHALWHKKTARQWIILKKKGEKNT